MREQGGSHRPRPLPARKGSLKIRLGQTVGIVAVEDAHAGDIHPQRRAQIAQNGLRFYGIGRLLFNIDTKNRHDRFSFFDVLCVHRRLHRANGMFFYIVSYFFEKGNCFLKIKFVLYSLTLVQTDPYIFNQI